jgi:hypothetical protein
MRIRWLLREPELALCCALLFAGLLRSQTPQPPGRLSVTSDPPGATITIDDQQMNRQTPFTFAISPGQHSVSVRGKDMYCAASLNVQSGAAKSVHCTARGWDPPVT